MTARGMRNLNPGNLEKTQVVWQGEIRPGGDERFCEFESLIMGCRALIKTLVTYHTKHGCSTVRSIIERWAPSHENDTESYMEHVASSISKGVDEAIPFDLDPTYYLAIAKAIARHENGVDALAISDDVWEEAYKLTGL